MKLYGLSDIVSITWLGDCQRAASRSLWDSRMANLQNDVPEYGKAEVLYIAMKESADLHTGLMFFYCVSLTKEQ